MSHDNTQLLTVEQVAEYCQLSQSTIYHWLCDGKLKHVKLGTAVRIRRQENCPIQDDPETRLVSNTE